MSMAVIGVVGLALTGTSIGLSASGAMNPQQPNLSASSAGLANAQADLLPIQRALEAGAQQGKSVTVNLPQHFESTKAVQTPLQFATQVIKGQPRQVVVGGGEWVPYVASDWDKGGKYNPDGSTPAPKVATRNIKVNAGPHTFDFSGYGAADVQGQLAQAMAKVQLAMSHKYDSQFIDQALQQEQEADPQSFEARQKWTSSSTIKSTGR
jgi:hypothetical protein